jgi:putative oxidoreductase
MNYLQRVEFWGDHHHPKWLDLLRIALGVFLCFKGIEFAKNMDLVEDMMTHKVPFSSFMLMLLSHYILFAHIMGGFLLAVGLLTRFACVVQIPVLIGAIIFINASMLWPFSEIFLSLLILILLVYFLVIGGGPWSLDRVIDRGNR